jgi:chromatin-remodeling ATPase INO80
MGLGKTIQSISLLAHLAERSNNWGPYLIVTPASTLHNWQQEFARFVPALRIIPYWGSVQDRKVLRSTCMPFWTGKKQVTRDTPFHVMITSYQLIVSDEAFLQKVKWQYMILDEAQAIKSSNSIRWKTLLNFKCRNRLLLTGTPIQNSMQELWALLHFIMPTLFDSHDEFSEWFSKDIESHAENRGSGLNSHQLHRLHMILKPFMLRRVKADVENEMGEKVEKDVICELSPRQKRLYRGIKDKLPLLDLIAGGASAGGTSGGNKYTFGFGIGSATNNTSATTNNSTTTNTSIISSSPSSNIDSALMNLVMQFRKVCNHPELLERTEILSPFSFTATGSITNSRDSSTTVFTNPPPIQLRLPKRIIQEVPLPNKRILLEVSNQLTHLGHQITRNLSFSPSANVLIPNLPNQSLSCIDSFNFLQDRFSMAAPIRVISKGPVMFPSNDLEDGNATHGLNHQLATPLHKSIAIPSMEKFIRDCGKLTKLDEMLVDLKANGHRVLVYNQMTRMIDLLEEYLQYRGYSYLRLDGSTNISTRRDLVHSWQTDPSIFVFLLSTRAGGLGINLTAADTVIFYDSDWNPTVDQQAMDRAHRLGQLKQVTVYRMITRNTIEERIMQRAKQKDQIHKVVIAGGAFKDSIPEDAALIDGKPKDRKEIMSLLLVDED